MTHAKREERQEDSFSEEQVQRMIGRLIGKFRNNSISIGEFNLLFAIVCGGDGDRVPLSQAEARLNAIVGPDRHLPFVDDIVMRLKD